MTRNRSISEYQLRAATSSERDEVVTHLRREHKTALIHDSELQTQWVLFVEGSLVGMFSRRDEALAGFNRFETLRSELVDIAGHATDYVRRRSTNPMYYGEEGFHRPFTTLATGITYSRGLYLLYSPAIDQGDGRYPGTSNPQTATLDLVNLCLAEIHQRYVDSTVHEWTMIDEMESVIGTGLQTERWRSDADAQANAMIEDIMRRMTQ